MHFKISINWLKNCRSPVTTPSKPNWNKKQSSKHTHTPTYHPHTLTYPPHTHTQNILFCEGTVCGFYKSLLLSEGAVSGLSYKFLREQSSQWFFTKAYFCVRERSVVFHKRFRLCERVVSGLAVQFTDALVTFDKWLRKSQVIYIGLAVPSVWSSSRLGFWWIPSPGRPGAQSMTHFLLLFMSQWPVGSDN